MLSIVPSCGILGTTVRGMDRSQLIKHAFGLMHTYPNQPITLIYLFWEPENWEGIGEFQAHRREIETFSHATAGCSHIEFGWQPYLDLWRGWDEIESPDWLNGHVKALKQRYGVRG
jgi:hypothetical protein